MKIRERDEARTLRREQGQSIKEIARAVGVSHSSVSRWVRDIELTTCQLAALADRNPILNAQRNGARVRSSRARAERQRAQNEGRAAATRGDPVHAAACMLYWGEGSKSRNQVQLSNSDPALVVFFARFLREYFQVPSSRMRVQCNLHAENAAAVVAIEEYWLSELGLTRASLTKSIVNSVSTSSKHKRFRMLPHGTCRLTVSSTAIVQHLYGAIQEYAGFDRPAWLD
jgi:transcriptional regulator with XRE-family HTH domain